MSKGKYTYKNKFLYNNLNNTIIQGRKCKYSHDLNIENQNKTQVINLYQDQREQLTLGEGNKEEDNMEDWDTEKLNEVVQAQ